MHQLIYTSRATRTFTATELVTLLARVRAKNAAVLITGCLLHVDGAFLQVLEGDAARVQTVFETIGKDPRHASVVTLLRRDIDRQFKDWSMGFIDGSGHAATMEGYRASTGFADLAGDPTRVAQIVSGFRAGRWRGAA